MNAKDLLTIATVALGTATLTVITLWTDPLEAGAESNPAAPEIARPTLTLEGVELTLQAPGDRTFSAGDEPMFELCAVNTTTEPAQVGVRVAMTASSPASMLSRLPAMPTMLWECQPAIVLAPGERRVMTLASATKLPVNSMIAVALQPVANPVAAGPRGLVTAVSPGMVALQFATVPDAVRGVRVAAN